MAILDPEVLAWELYAENIIPSTLRNAANNMMYERGKRISDLLAALVACLRELTILTTSFHKNSSPTVTLTQ